MFSAGLFKNAASRILIPMTLALLFFGIHSHYNRLEKLSSSQLFDKSKFESEIHSHQRTLINELRILLERASALEHSADICYNPHIDGEFSYYMFVNDSLVSWINASVAPDSLVSSKIGTSAVSFPNGFYLEQCMRLDSITVCGLFRIKSGYAYENEYLYEKFHPSFKLSSIPEIVTSPIDNGFNISDINGDYLFSLRFNESKPVMGDSTMINLVAFFLFVLFLVILLGNILRLFVLPLSKEYTLLLGLLLLLVVYFSLLSVRFSPALLSYPLMSPSAYALAWWLPSLGFFVILSFFIFSWSLWFYWFNDGIVQSFIQSAKGNSILKVAAGVALSAIFFVIANLAVTLLVEHSKDLAFFVEPVDLSIVTIAKLIVVSMLVFAFVLVTEKVTVLMISWMKLRLPVTVVVLVTILLLLLMLVSVGSSIVEAAIVFVLMFFVFLVRRQKHRTKMSYGALVWIVFVFSLFFILRVSYLSDQKEKSNRNLLIQNLSFKLMREDDPIAEMFLPQIESRISSDVFIGSQLTSGTYNTRIINDYLRKNFFEGYFSRYDLQVIPCDIQSNLMVTGYSEPYHYYTFFRSMIDELGVRLSPNSSFYFLRDGDGLSTYFGQFQYVDSVTGNEARLYLELNSKPYFVGLGYPELLTNKRDRLNIEQYGGYSYAKYVNGNLVSRFGDFDYQPTDKWLKRYMADASSFFDIGRYSHLLFDTSDNQTVVLSYPKLTFRLVSVNFSLVFIGVLLITSLLFAVSRKVSGISFRFVSIEERIKVSFVFMLVFLLIVMCIITVVVSIRDFRTKNRELMSDKLRSVTVDLQHHIGSGRYLETEDHVYINQQLQKASNVFYTDINLYGVDGRLVGTSRPELFSKGVASPVMNNTAFCSLLHMQIPEFMCVEKIGELSYMSGYVPFYNYENRLLGYINIPYFVGTTDLHQKLSAVLVSILSTYLLFMMLAVGVAILFSRQIAAPLIAIRENIKNVELGKKNAPIHYSNRDEIGSLVDEYNRMLDELALSAAKLTASERESTWREMAKQVAHEINNPLTPMKLSVQYLQKAWNDKRPDYASYMNRVTDTLIEQIDQLSVIASEFSAFAKMPPMNPECINIVEKVRNAVLLFEQESDMEFNLDIHGEDELIVFADNDQMGSVFNNLLKNAIQAVPNGTSGVIDVSVSKHNNRAKIAITDNGQGIPPEIQEKIFKPNFTTKSKGMGIGLAIVKNIVVGLNGDIWFETKHNEGTTFFVTLPLYSEA